VRLYHLTGDQNLLNGELSPDQAEVIAGWLKVSAQDVLDVHGRMRGDCSIDVKISREGERAITFGDVTALDNEHRQSRFNFEELRNLERLDDVLQDEALADALSTLDETERRVFEARWCDHRPVSYTKLAAELRITRYRVTEIERQAVARIRLALMPLPPPKAYDDRLCSLAADIVRLDPRRTDFTRRHGEITMALEQHAWSTRKHFNVLASLAKQFRELRDPALVHERGEIAESLRQVN
jgi:RNA polymerase sigma factor (sigma-70 family)